MKRLAVSPLTSDRGEGGLSKSRTRRKHVVPVPDAGYLSVEPSLAVMVCWTSMNPTLQIRLKKEVEAHLNRLLPAVSVPLDAVLATEVHPS